METPCSRRHSFGFQLRQSLRSMLVRIKCASRRQTSGRSARKCCSRVESSHKLSMAKWSRLLILRMPIVRCRARSSSQFPKHLEVITSPIVHAQSGRHVYEIGEGLGMHLSHHPGPMCLHSDFADAELTTDLLIQLTTNHQCHHLPFSTTERTVARSQCLSPSRSRCSSRRSREALPASVPVHAIDIHRP